MSIPGCRMAGVLVAAACVTAPAQAGPVVQLESSSLTNYRAAATGVQGVMPMFEQRGSTLEGSLRGGYHGYAPAPVTYEPEECKPLILAGAVDLATLTYSAGEVDLSLPTDGPPVLIGRTFNHRQDESGKRHGSYGKQGHNWFQSVQPEIVLVAASGGDPAMVYLVTGANRFFEFKEVSSGVFEGVNGTNAVFVYESKGGGNYDTYTMYDHSGTRMVFWGDNTGTLANRQLWKIIDPAGREAYVEDKSSDTNAVSNGYDSEGGIKSIYQEYGSAGQERRYTLSYSGSLINGKYPLTEVKVETKTGGTWASPSGLAEIGRVTYDYYTSTVVHVSDGNDSFGQAGDLKSVKIRRPLTDSGSTLGSGVYHESTRYYRYYVGSWSNADNQRGHAHNLKLIVGAEGARRYDMVDDATLNDSWLSSTSVATSAVTGGLPALKSYSEAWFEYESDSDEMRISKAFFNGECGCGGGVNGVYTLAQSDNGGYTDGAGYDTDWKSRTLVTQPDGTWVTRYLDETGQALSTVVTDSNPAGSPTKTWVTGVERNGDGRINAVHSPANLNTYTHSTGALAYLYSAGLITSYNRVASGVLEGLVESVTFQTGTGGSAYYVSETAYSTRSLSVAGVTVDRPMVDSQKSFFGLVTSPASGYEIRSYSYSWWSSTASDIEYLLPKTVTTTYPAVDLAKHGANTSATTVAYVRKDGRTAFVKGRDDVFTAMTYNAQGLVAKSVQDADLTAGIYDTNYTPGVSDFNISTSTSGALHYVTQYAYDPIGRATTTTLPSGRDMFSYYSRVADGRLVTLSFPRVSGSTYDGPVSYSVSNLAGRSELQCTLGVASVATSGGGGAVAMTSWVTESTTDPLDALDSVFTGASRVNVFQLGTTVFDNAGSKATENRQYHLVPSSGYGSSPTNYDATAYAYDDMGRVNRVTDATATITRTVFDALGRISSRWVGTDDTHGWAAATGNGSSGGSDNMTQVELVEYDSGGIGNSHLTKRIAFVSGHSTTGVGSSTGQRATEYLHDVRGNVRVVVNPESPHIVNAFDVQRRVTATAMYSTTSGLSVSTDPTASASNRLTLSERFYDERGQLYKATRHEVAQTGGSAGSSTDSLDTLYWYDAAGRGIMVAGEALGKTFYDRLGRVTHRFELARTNDDFGGTYADATTVSGDLVLEEARTVFDNADKTGNVMMTATISRPHTDTSSTGALDSNADNNVYKFTAANLAGRVQIASMWYDSLDRPIESVQVGDNGGSDYDRRPSGWASVPSRSSTALRTTTVYNDNGTVREVQSPRERAASTPIVTRYQYDAAGRKTAEIRNYINGTPSGPTGDDDIVTRFEFAGGLMIAMWVDVGGDDTDGHAPVGGYASSPADDSDQVTQYVYGQNKGTGTGDSKIASNRLLKQVKYPPGEVTSNDPQERSQYFAYNAQGQRIYLKDQNGTEHAYEYDDSGRQIHDRAIGTFAGAAGPPALPATDTGVLRISTSYETRGMVATVTQHTSATVGSGSVTDEVKYTYDGWGNLLTYQEDRDSAVGVSTANDFGVAYTYAKANDTGTAGGSHRRSGVRRTTNKLQYAGADKQQVNHAYDSSSSLDADVGRVTRLTLGASSPPDIAEYLYLGAGRVVDTKLSEPAISSRLHSGGSHSGYLDRFNRVLSSRWERSGGSGTYYQVDLSYDENSNITSAEDVWVPQWSVVYTMDSLDRVTRANSGAYSGGSITTSRLDEQWTVSGTAYLTQTGNWDRYKRDRFGSNELDHTFTSNRINQLTLRDTDGGGSSTGNYAPAYDYAGNLVDDDGRTPTGTYTYGYTYTYDAWNRLRKVYKQDTTTLVEEFRYNGLGHRIGWHYDVDADGTVENTSDDPWRYFAFNERWQQVAMYTGSDTSPTETFVYHEAGRDGRGGSSYIDAVVLRDRDTNADGGRDERRYYLQNWRYDVVMIVGSGGYMYERIRYNAYGRPESHSLADVAYLGGAAVPDGSLTSDDLSAFLSAFFGGTATYQCDLVGTGGAGGPDGSVTADDLSNFYSRYFGGYGGGIGLVSEAAVDNRKGYAGYEYDTVLAGAGGATSHARYHVRNRVLDSNTGKWIQEDKLGYVDGMSLFQYCGSAPLVAVDSVGLQCNLVHNCANGGEQGPPMGVAVPIAVPWLIPAAGACAGVAIAAGCVVVAGVVVYCTVEAAKRPAPRLVPNKEECHRLWKIYDDACALAMSKGECRYSDPCPLICLKYMLFNACFVGRIAHRNAWCWEGRTREWQQVHKNAIADYLKRMGRCARAAKHKKPSPCDCGFSMLGDGDLSPSDLGPLELD